MATGTPVSAVANIVRDPGVGTYDLILMAVRREQLATAARSLSQVAPAPCILVLGNNPAGRAALPTDLPGTTSLGFPGIGGTVVDGVAEYLRIAQQPTTIATGNHPALTEFVTTMRHRGFTVSQTPHMEGWLAYHATFVACVAAALYRCGTDPLRLAADRRTLTLMCRAITEGFAVQRTVGRTGLPRNLAILHHPLLRPVAVRYWAGQLRAPLGELCFAAHARHAKPEMLALADDVLAVAGDRPNAGHLRRLLGRSAPAD
jgi:ketopantoate reductase